MQLNEFLQSEIKQKLSSVQQITSITAIADKKIIGIFCASGEYCALHFSLLLKLNTFFSFALFSPRTHNGEEIKLTNNYLYRSSHPQVFLRKAVLIIRSKFAGEHPCQHVISIKLICNFIEITLRHGCSPVSLLHIFRTSFPENTSGWLLLYVN